MQMECDVMPTGDNSEKMPAGLAGVAGRFSFFQEMVRCCFPVQFWEYHSDLSPITPITEENTMTACFLKYSSAFSTLQECIRKGDFAPAFIHESAGLYWVADFAMDGQKLQRVYLMGPFIRTERERQAIRQRFYSADQPLDIHKRLIKALNDIPMIPSSYLFQYAIMFHFAITGQKSQISDFQHPFTSRRQEDIFEAEEKKEEGQSGRHIGVWQAETQLMNAIRNGDLDYRSSVSRASLASAGVKMKDMGTLRACKDDVILFIGFCRRASISGGVPPEIAYDMCDQYVDLAESTDSISELMHVNDTMVDNYVRKVRYYQGNTSLSKPVKICCDYIHIHVAENITLEALSKLCNYTEYYLSRKFKKETGMTPGEYILRAKLDRACVLLSTTTHSIQDISDSLSFSSRSYFSTVFQKYKGYSPSQYRENSKGTDQLPVSG